MKGTDRFKRTIQMFLEQRAAEDELFAKSYRNPAKNIDDCVTYLVAIVFCFMRVTSFFILFFSPY